MIKKVPPWVGVALFVILLVLMMSFDILITGRAIEEVENTGSFNLEVTVPAEYQQIAVGDTLWFTTKVFNLAQQQRVDVILTYQLVDEQGTVIASRSETVAIETQASFVGSIEVPQELEKGEYDLVVEMLSDSGQSVTGTTKVSIVYTEDLQGFFKNNRTWIILIAVLLVVLLLTFKMKPVMSKIKKRRQSKARIKKLIQGKIASKKLTAEELKNAKLPTTKPTTVKKDEQIF